MITQQNTIRIITLSLLFFVSTSFAIECRLMEGNSSPEAVPLLNESSAPLEKWCWIERVPTQDSILVFRVQGSTFANELSYLVTTNENVSTLKYVSVGFGQRSLIVQQNQEVFPFPTLSQLKTSPNKILYNSDLSEDKMNALYDFAWDLFIEDSQRLNTNTLNPINRTFRVENDEAELDEENLPLDGYWWPHRNLPLAKEEYSPLAKYDRFVQSYYGENPNSRDWEKTYHSLSNVPWGGHCNGWVASTILHGFDENTYFNPKTRDVIRPQDVQGMRTETSFCVDLAFYGARYNGKPEDDIEDISPDKFHRVLVYYLKYLKKAVALDYYRDEKVDNNIISGYDFRVTPNPDEPNEYDVIATLKIHRYTDAYINSAQVAPSYYKTFRYKLFTNSIGDITGGKWITSNNPDFLWVPLKQAKCGRENPRMHHSYVDAISKKLKVLSSLLSNWTLTSKNIYAEEEQLTLDESYPDVYFTSLNLKIKFKSESDYLLFKIEYETIDNREKELSLWLRSGKEAELPFGLFGAKIKTITIVAYEDKNIDIQLLKLYNAKTLKF